MNPKLRSIIFCAIENAMTEASDQNLWDEYIHPTLTKQMAYAAELVFDAAQESQEYRMKEENG